MDALFKPKSERRTVLPFNLTQVIYFLFSIYTYFHRLQLREKERERREEGERKNARDLSILALVARFHCDS